MRGENVERPVPKALDVRSGDFLPRPPVVTFAAEEPVKADRASESPEAQTSPLPSGASRRPRYGFTHLNQAALVGERSPFLERIMILVIPVEPHEVSPCFAGALIDVVEPGILPAGPQPEVAQLQDTPAIVSKGGFTGDTSPVFISVPVAGEHHPTAGSFVVRVGVRSAGSAVIGRHPYILSDLTMMEPDSLPDGCSIVFKASPCSSAGKSGCLLSSGSQVRVLPGARTVPVLRTSRCGGLGSLVAEIVEGGCDIEGAVGRLADDVELERVEVMKASSNSAWIGRM